MKELLLLRHAKSSWKHPELDDHDRPLNKRGKRNAPRMGELLREQNLVPNMLVSSTAKRAHDTATAVAESSGYADEIRLARELYWDPPSRWLDLLRKVSDVNTRVLLVAHNPGLETILETLTGDEEVLPTAALCHVVLDIPAWHELDAGSGRLLAVWRPRELN